MNKNILMKILGCALVMSTFNCQAIELDNFDNNGHELVQQHLNHAKTLFQSLKSLENNNAVRNVLRGSITINNLINCADEIVSNVNDIDYDNLYTRAYEQVIKGLHQIRESTDNNFFNSNQQNINEYKKKVTLINNITKLFDEILYQLTVYKNYGR